MTDKDWDDLEVLRTLVSELRGRMPPNLTERQYQDIGSWMLKAVWLGQGVPYTEVLAIDTPEQPRLRLVSSNAP